MKEKPPRYSRQKAIDGIIHGAQGVPDPLHAPVQRRRFRGMQDAQHPPVNPHRHSQLPREEKPAVSHSSEQLIADLQPVALQDVPVAPRKRTKRRGRFFGRKWEAIKSWSLRKKIIVGILTLALLVGLVLGGLFLKGYFNAKKVFKGGGSALSLQSQVDVSKLKGEGDGRINILLLGVGGAGHEAPDLTDTIMVASIDPVNHKTALLSIPRDLWVNVPGKGNMKINAVYETGKYAYSGRQNAANDQAAVKAGFKLVDKTLEDVIGIPIHYHTLVNFNAFQKAVDTVGGITVNVPERLYDPTMAWQNGGNPVLAQAGTQQFDGRQALMYVRSRYTTSDFARSQRQRAVIVALQQKIFSLGTFSDPVKISQLMDAFGSNVVTDLSLNDVSRLYTINKKIDPNTIQSVGLTDEANKLVTTGMLGGQSVVVPIAGAGNYAAIQSFVRNTLRDGYLAKENATVMVLNGTEVPGAATAAADVLKSYGYTVGTVGDAPTKQYKKTVIVDLTKGKNKKPYTAQYLKLRYKVDKVTTKLPDHTIQTQNADFVVILGEDETTNSQN